MSFKTRMTRRQPCNEQGESIPGRGKELPTPGNERRPDRIESFSEI